MDRNDLGKVIAQSATEIDEIPWIDNPELPGVRHKVLWQSGTTVLGLMTIDPGASNPQHTHHGAHHHILLLDGQCQMLGKTVGPGGYIYVPPGTPHEAITVGDQPCVFFYTYRPVEVAPAELEEVVAV